MSISITHIIRSGPGKDAVKIVQAAFWDLENETGENSYIICPFPIDFCFFLIDF